MLKTTEMQDIVQYWILLLRHVKLIYGIFLHSVFHFFLKMTAGNVDEDMKKLKCLCTLVTQSGEAMENSRVAPQNTLAQK